VENTKCLIKTPRDLSKVFHDAEGFSDFRYWFGDEPYKFRGGLWWRGIDPAMPLDGQEGTSDD